MAGKLTSERAAFASVITSRERADAKVALYARERQTDLPLLTTFFYIDWKLERYYTKV